MIMQIYNTLQQTQVILCVLCETRDIYIFNRAEKLNLTFCVLTGPILNYINITCRFNDATGGKNGVIPTDFT